MLLLLHPSPSLAAQPNWCFLVSTLLLALPTAHLLLPKITVLVGTTTPRVQPYIFQSVLSSHFTCEPMQSTLFIFQYTSCTGWKRPYRWRQRIKVAVGFRKQTQYVLVERVSKFSSKFLCRQLYRYEGSPRQLYVKDSVSYSEVIVKSEEASFIACLGLCHEMDYNG